MTDFSQLDPKEVRAELADAVAVVNRVVKSPEARPHERTAALMVLRRAAAKADILLTDIVRYGITIDKA